MQQGRVAKNLIATPSAIEPHSAPTPSRVAWAGRPNLRMNHDKKGSGDAEETGKSIVQHQRGRFCEPPDLLSLDGVACRRGGGSRDRILCRRLPEADAGAP